MGQQASGGPPQPWGYTVPPPGARLAPFGAPSAVPLGAWPGWGAAPSLRPSPAPGWAYGGGPAMSHTRPAWATYATPVPTSQYHLPSPPLAPYFGSPASTVSVWTYGETTHPSLPPITYHLHPPGAVLPAQFAAPVGLPAGPPPPAMVVPSVARYDAGRLPLPLSAVPSYPHALPLPAPPLLAPSPQPVPLPAYPPWAGPWLPPADPGLRAYEGYGVAAPQPSLTGFEVVSVSYRQLTPFPVTASGLYPPPALPAQGFPPAVHYAPYHAFAAPLTESLWPEELWNTRGGSNPTAAVTPAVVFEGPAPAATSPGYHYFTPSATEVPAPTHSSSRGTFTLPALFPPPEWGHDTMHRATFADTATLPAGPLVQANTEASPPSVARSSPRSVARLPSPYIGRWAPFTADRRDHTVWRITAAPDDSVALARPRDGNMPYPSIGFPSSDLPATASLDSVLRARP
eukprot:EG_transcript_7690